MPTASAPFRAMLKYSVEEIEKIRQFVSLSIWDLVIKSLEDTEIEFLIHVFNMCHQCRGPNLSTELVCTLDVRGDFFSWFPKGYLIDKLKFLNDLGIISFNNEDILTNDQLLKARFWYIYLKADQKDLPNTLINSSRGRTIIEKNEVLCMRYKNLLLNI